MRRTRPNTKRKKNGKGEKNLYQAGRKHYKGTQLKKFLYKRQFYNGNANYLITRDKNLRSEKMEISAT